MPAHRCEALAQNLLDNGSPAPPHHEAGQQKSEVVLCCLNPHAKLGEWPVSGPSKQSGHAASSRAAAPWVMLPGGACLQGCILSPPCPACVSPRQHKGQAQLLNGHAVHHERALASGLQVGLVGSMQLLQSGPNSGVKLADVVQVQGLPQRRPAGRMSLFRKSTWKLYTVSPTMVLCGSQSSCRQAHRDGLQVPRPHLRPRTA